MRIAFKAGAHKHARGGSVVTIRTYFEPGSTVVGTVDLLDQFGGEEIELAELRMTPAEARSYANVLTEMADMAERRPHG